MYTLRSSRHDAMVRPEWFSSGGARMANHLYYGDNLVVLRESIKDESVDLVYLDPPFNSNAKGLYQIVAGGLLTARRTR